MRFALVEKSACRQERTAEAVLELVLASGERLRIGTGVDITIFNKIADQEGYAGESSHRVHVR